MAPARKRRRLPTLIDRGIGLLEVILPHGSGDEPISTLPEGRRDTGGFWFPSGYTRPGDIFTPEQRKLQAKQRQVQRQRNRSSDDIQAIVSGSEGTAAADTAPLRPHAPPAAPPGAPDRPRPEGALADRTLPLPPPYPEAPDTGSRPQPHSAAASAMPPECAARSIAIEPPAIRAETLRPIVDSQQGSE
ncbi:MAG: hypothetical protein AUI47_10035 [Acidobacteria bacterium 13_1_40CM_2_68_5]|nr:MAG: hypothetical protein AUI47_10035 [Acidobacteria bacterium 13_1_40CM_2_68_5]